MRWEIAQEAFCKLCQRLHQPQQQQIYRDFVAWWGNENHCHQGDLIIPLKFSFFELDYVKPWTRNVTSVSVPLSSDEDIDVPK
jgi:hypothetical protein